MTIRHTFFKAGTDSYEFKEGANLLRLLPQPPDSENAWATTVPYLYAEPKATSGAAEFVPLTQAQEAALRKVSNAVQGKRKRIGLCIDYCTVFFGFEITDPEQRVMPIVLPSNGFGVSKPEGELKSGTAIVRFMFEIGRDDMPKYGNLVDSTDGRSICVTVAGTGSDRNYEASVAEPAPLKPQQFSRLMRSVRKFEDILDYRSNAELAIHVRARLPNDVQAHFLALLETVA